MPMIKETLTVAVADERSFIGAAPMSTGSLPIAIVDGVPIYITGVPHPISLTTSVVVTIKS